MKRKAERIVDALTESDHDLGHGAPGGKPAPRRVASLSDILNPNQIQAVVDILNRKNLDDIEQTKLLKEYLGKFTEQLKTVGVDSNWLAYWFMHSAPKFRSLVAGDPPSS